jgi:hypothetical protein
VQFEGIIKKGGKTNYSQVYDHRKGSTTATYVKWGQDKSYEMILEIFFKDMPWETYMVHRRRG